MTSKPTEAETRRDLIDHQLIQAGWSLGRGNLKKELPLASEPGRLREQQAAYKTSDERADYALLGRDGTPIGIVEAKRSNHDALAGKRQAADDADRLQAHFKVDPFIFLCNEQEIWLWDRDRYAPRKISAFFSPNDLERLVIQRRQRQPLSSFSPHSSIIDRLYQREAVKRVTEGLEQGQRLFLLVMATGTGKTRTVVALIDLLMRARWVQRILFLADRRELVRQALSNFKEYMPNETLAQIEGREWDESARIHVATYPSMMQVYQRLSAGFYDLIIADESHRSIYNRYRTILQHFDALQIGLTATPTDYIDHNTFELFGCLNGLPTFYYPYTIAVRERYLVNYRVLDAQTSFQLEGIKAGQLPLELQRQLEEQGVDLAELEFEGSDLERRVTNSGTNDTLVQEFMMACRKDASGMLPAKTIMFAMSHHHAIRLWESFNRLYPDLQRRGVAEIIDSHMERAEKTLDDFKRKEMPRVAISVDMLDTGVDLPAIQNLVFAKPVFSQVKFWQMIGRGTRLWTDPLTGTVKQDFLIIDHWNNFSYFNLYPDVEVASATEPMPVRLFRLLIQALSLFYGHDQPQAAEEVATRLRAMLATLPDDNVNIRPYRTELKTLADPAPWRRLDAMAVEHLHTMIAPLLRFMPDVNLSIMTFEVRAERLAIAYVKGDTAEVEQVREQVLHDLAQLPMHVPEVQAQSAMLAWVQSDAFWQHLSYERIIELRQTVAPLIRFRHSLRREMIELDLPDAIARRRWIIYGPGGEGAFAESYREQVEAHVHNLAAQLPALVRLQQQQPLDESDVQALADQLNRPDLFINEDVLRQVYDQQDADLTDFLRHILGLSHLPNREEQIQEAFEEFIVGHPHYSAKQINMLRAVRSAVLRRARLSNADLERPPFSRIGLVHQLFSLDELEEILEFANRLAA